MATNSQPPSKKELKAYALNFIKHEKDLTFLKKRLESKGADQKMVEEVMQEIRQEIYQPEMEVDRNSMHGNIILGALIAGAGIVFTIATAVSASATGGTYIIAWGAILYGGYLIVRGFLNLDNK